MTDPKPARHRAPIRAIHQDGSTCTHRQARGRTPGGPDCPGRTSYTATCTRGDFTVTNGIRAYVEEQARHHINSHNA